MKLSTWCQRLMSRWWPATKHDIEKATEKILMKASEMVPILNEIKTELDDLKKTLVKVDADITRILEQNPDLPETVVEALNAVKLSATEVKTAAVAIDERNPEPPVTP